jgi:predicted  nucleic acid-binding Zn-ribbon protein
MKDKIERGEQVQPEDFFQPTADEVADQTFGELKTPDPMVGDEDRQHVSDGVAPDVIVDSVAAVSGEDREIKIQIDGEVVTTTRSAYIKAKTADLKAFGFESLTEDETAAQVDKILAGDRDGLDIIGNLCLDDFVFDADEGEPMPDPATGLISGTPPDYHDKKSVRAIVKREFDDDENIKAENIAQASATSMIESEKLLDAVWTTRDDEGDIRELSADEREQLEYFESKIEDGLKKYISIGKWLFAIWSNDLHKGEFKSWREYVQSKWKMNASGAYDLMKAFRTWRLASSTETMTLQAAVAPERWLTGTTGEDEVHDGEIVDSPNDVCVCGDTFADHHEDKKGRQSCEKCACSEYSHDPEGKAADDEPKPKKAESKPKATPQTSDADAPSQRAIEELSKLTGKLEKNDLTENDFAEFEAAAVRWLYQGLRDTIGDKEITQKTIAEAMDAFVEFAKAKAFEIDGEHYSPETVNAADFRITRGLFEGLQREREGIREMLDARRARMATPQERSNSEYSFVPPVDENGDVKSGTPELKLFCSVHGEQDVHVFMFGAVQLKCGDVFGKPKGQDKVLFNPKLTKDNPLSDEAASA